MKVCCCEWKGMVGTHCDPCEGGAHNLCEDPKEMKPPMPEDDPDLREQFEREARVAPAPILSIPTAQFGPAPDGGPQGVWVAYQSDLSEMAFFADELSALRYAVTNSMSAELIPYGVGLREYINRRTDDSF